MLNIAHRATEKEFAHFDLFYRDSKQKVQADRVNILGFLKDRGYYLYRTSVNRHIFIRIIDNIVKEVGKKDIEDEILEFIKENETRGVYEAFLTNKGKFFNDDFLRSLPAKQVDFRKDKENAIQLYYQNCIVKITATTVTTHPYTDLTGYIWESQILPRSFKQEKIADKSDFARYIENICNKDIARINSICSAFGFYLHNFKDPSNCPAVILNDEIISENPEGGTGKSLFFDAVSKFIKTVVVDGELFSFEKSFAYQRITPETRLLFFDDTKKGFKFEKLKSFLTGGATTEKKGKDEIYIPFEDSPKVGIATNYGINNAGNSLERRSFEVEISQYYNKQRKPDIEFGHRMFTGWNEKNNQWVQFDNYAILCCQVYLTAGLIEQKLINLPEKKLKTQTNDAFLEFMEDFRFEGEIAKKSMLDQFLVAYPKYKNADWLTVNFFTKWLKVYCDFHKISLETEKRDKTGAIRVYKFDNFPIIKVDF